METQWLNNKRRIHSPEKIDKPCYKCGFCPYGQLVEEFPLHEEFKGQDLNELSKKGKLDTGYNCKLFGHDCPVFYTGEMMTE